MITINLGDRKNTVNGHEQGNYYGSGRGRSQVRGQKRRTHTESSAITLTSGKIDCQSTLNLPDYIYQNMK